MKLRAARWLTDAALSLTRLANRLDPPKQWMPTNSECVDCGITPRPGFSRCSACLSAWMRED